MFPEPTDTVPAAECQGFISRRVAQWLAAGPEPVSDPAVAARSPLGANALRLRPMPTDDPASACRRLAAWLACQPWVGSLAERPPHVYCQPTADAAAQWVEHGMADRSAELRAGALAAACRPPAADAPATSLHAFRVRAVQHAAHMLANASGGNLSVQDLPVEGIDVPQGTLRARSGGSVLLPDVLTLLQTQAGELPPRATTMPAAADALRLFLLRWPRTQRIALTDARLAGCMRSLSDVLDACAGAVRGDTGPVAGAADTARECLLRVLAQQVDLFDNTVSRAAGERDPCRLVRFVLAVAQHLDDADALLPAHARLRTAARQAMSAALALAALPVIAVPHAAHEPAPHVLLPVDP